MVLGTQVKSGRKYDRFGNSITLLDCKWLNLFFLVIKICLSHLQSLWWHIQTMSWIQPAFRSLSPDYPPLP